MNPNPLLKFARKKNHVPLLSALHINKLGLIMPLNRFTEQYCFSFFLLQYSINQKALTFVSVVL